MVRHGFRAVGVRAGLTPIFQRALSAETWRERETALSEAYGIVAGMHNALGITDPLPTAVSPFHGRPYQVIHGDAFADALRAQISDPEVKRIAEQTWIGSIDQFSDSTDLHETMSLRAALRALYD